MSPINARMAAELVESSVASVNSALQRARATMRRRLPERGTDWTAVREVTEEERTILQRYMDATERSDAAGLTALLAEDARQTMPPAPLWLQGRDVIGAKADWYMVQHPLGDWRALRVGANLQPVAAFYLRANGRPSYRLMGLDGLTIHRAEIVTIDTFYGELIKAFNLPPPL